MKSNTWIHRHAKEKGLKIVEAKKPLLLEVRGMDIARATKKDPQSCGFARACKRSHKVKAAYFFRTTAWLEYSDRIVRYILPQSMQREIVAFDRNQTMAPGLYQLSRPYKSATLKYNRETVRAAYVRKVEAKKAGKKLKPPPFTHRTTDVRGMSVA